MAEDPNYIYPVKSVVLPKRLHNFLSLHSGLPVFNATTVEYHQLFDLFYPMLCLPLNLEIDVVIRIFEVAILPFFRRQQSFDRHSCIFSYISVEAHPRDQKPYPSNTLLLPRNLVKFMELHDDRGSIVEATLDEYHQIIELFFLQLRLPRCFNKTTLIGIFDILVRPFFENLQDFDEEIGFVRYLTVEVIPRIGPDNIPIQSVTLPTNLHSFLAFTNPKVRVTAGPTNEDIRQIVQLFHPRLNDLFSNGRSKNSNLMGDFELLVLPYLRNVLSFNTEDNTLAYKAVKL